MSLNTTAIVGSKQAPGATSAKACSRGQRSKSLFDFREKRLTELDDLGLQVTGGIGRLPPVRKKMHAQIDFTIGHRGRTRSAQLIDQHPFIFPECRINECLQRFLGSAAPIAPPVGRQT